MNEIRCRHIPEESVYKSGSIFKDPTSKDPKYYILCQYSTDTWVAVSLTDGTPFNIFSDTASAYKAVEGLEFVASDCRIDLYIKKPRDIESK